MGLFEEALEHGIEIGQSALDKYSEARKQKKLPKENYIQRYITKEISRVVQAALEVNSNGQTIDEVCAALAGTGSKYKNRLMGQYRILIEFYSKVLQQDAETFNDAVRKAYTQKEYKAGLDMATRVTQAFIAVNFYSEELREIANGIVEWIAAEQVERFFPESVN